MTENALHCFSCGRVIPHHGVIGRRDECPHCGADVHVCRNCKFYDTTAYNECREPSAEPVHEKERANFCGWFVATNGQVAKEKQSDTLAAAEALFKKK